MKLAPLTSLVIVACLLGDALAFPTSNQRGGQQGVRIQPAQLISDLGPKIIPDSAHPYRAPRGGDLRGPCPGMNSMANHGYINRNGVDTFENMVLASQEAWALGKEFAEMVVGYSVLVRGNPYLNLLSIGGESPLIPPMPGNVDGQRPGGLSQHNRFEGDNSQVHDDFAINGDAITFNATKFERLVHFTRMYGDKNGTVANRRAISEFKYDNHRISMAENPNYNLEYNRMNLAYNEIALTTELFPNGTNGELTMEVAENFFSKNTFTPNWSRRPTQLTFAEAGATIGDIRGLHPGPVIAGRYVNGEYVPYPVPEPSLGAACDVYTGMMDHIPAAYLNTTGLFRENVDFLLDRIHNVFYVTQQCAKQEPRGPSRT